jgi:hypothetical protein
MGGGGSSSKTQSMGTTTSRGVSTYTEEGRGAP